MKENQDNQELKENQFVNEFEELLYDEVEAKNKKNKRETNLSIYNYSEKKLEKYKLLNEEDEILLCKEDILNEIKSKKENKEEEIKIKELYNGEDNDSFYYINKKELKRKYLMRTDLNDENENIHEVINNKDEKEMEKLYNEVQMKHPRKIVDGKITRYSFFSWSGFFCCNKPEYISLGQAYFSYFNTIKLLILVFLLISITNSPLIKSYRQFYSVYNITDDKPLLKPTLGNTIIRYFNATTFLFEKSHLYTPINISFDCGDNLLDEILLIVRYYQTIIKIYNFNFTQKEFLRFYEIFAPKKLINMGVVSEMNFYEFDNCSCPNQHKCNMIFNIYYYNSEMPYYNKEDLIYDNMTDVYYYSCRISKNDENIDVKKKEEELKTEIIIISLLTLIILIIFYISYKKGISRDRKEYEKNKIFINNYTLVLHNLKINNNDYNQELSDLISFLNNIVQKYKHLFISYHENYKEITDLNVFDISISNVNGRKLQLFNQIKSLQNKIEDILVDNDSIRNKVKNNIRGIYHSVENIAINLSEKKGEEKNNQQEEEILKEKIIEEPEKEEDYNLEKQIKIGKAKTEINEKINSITIDITKLHKEYNLKNYSNIYITFRNPLIPNLIYDIYNKSKIIRFFYFIFCQNHKLKKYYYKNQ